MLERFFGMMMLNGIWVFREQHGKTEVLFNFRPGATPDAEKTPVFVARAKEMHFSPVPKLRHLAS